MSTRQTSTVNNPAPVGIGLIGLGCAGTFHLERIALRDDCRVVAAFDDCANATNRAAGLVPGSAKDRTELLGNPAVELVLVATPPASHAALAIEALAAGKHVVVETPLALNLFEADAILQASRRANRSVIVAHTHRWDEDFLLARHALEAPGLGRLRMIRQIRWQYNPRLAAAVPQDWRDSPASGGGALWEFGIHDLDLLLQLAGESPTSISAELFPRSAPERADDGFLCLAQFPSGLVAHIEFNRGFHSPLNTGWILVGENASYAAGAQYQIAADGEVVDGPVATLQHPTGDFYQAVVGHLRAGGPNPVPAEQARAAIELIEAARRAARTGLPQSRSG